MSVYPQPRPGVLEIEPYVPGKSGAPGVAKVFKLSSNETPLGPSPRAVAAYRAVGAHLEDYPDGSASRLREAIGRAFGLDPSRIVCGAGSDDLLNLLARVYLADGDEAIYTTHGFLVFPIATPGIISGVLLSIARVIGETAPVLILVGYSRSINLDIFNGNMASLPLLIYSELTNPEHAGFLRIWGAALTLIIMVATINLIAAAINLLVRRR